MGKAKGIFPGRVSWVYSPETVTFQGEGNWWDDSYVDQVGVNKMLDAAIIDLTGSENIRTAWDSVFIYHNRQKEKESLQYVRGEKIAVKLNLNNSATHTYKGKGLIASPQVVYSLCKSLVQYGVPDTCIVLYDITRAIPDLIFNRVKSDYPGVLFVDNLGGNGRIKFTTDFSVPIEWSENLIIEQGGGNPTYLPTCVTGAEYMINLGALKGHTLAGITICAKNHIGSFYSYSEEIPSHSYPKAAGIHPYIVVHDYHVNTYWNFDMRPMGSYNCLVDLMGHVHLGGKTMLYLVDALYASTQQGGSLISGGWLSKPFRGQWTSSMLVSFDGVAIESVGLDLLSSEPSMTEVYGNVDNFLHEAALAQEPPSGVLYEPSGTNAPLGSLGVHEHWNNAVDKKYSRNLGTGEGIELSALKISGPDLTVPASLLIVEDPENDHINIEWEDVCTIEDYYLVEKAQDFNGPFTVIAILPENTIHYADSTAGTGTLYYRLRTKDVFGYSGYSEITSILKLAIHKPAAGNAGIKVYPVPASIRLIVTIQDPTEKQVKLNMYTLDGKLLIHKIVEPMAKAAEINVSGLADGNYILRRIDSGESIKVSILKE